MQKKYMKLTLFDSCLALAPQARQFYFCRFPLKKHWLETNGKLKHQNLGAEPLKEVSSKQTNKNIHDVLMNFFQITW